MQTKEPYLQYSPEVQKALKEGLPVVALESTIISHGMPYPKNLETALAVEDVIRSEGATPATIAIINGKLLVGLSREQLEFIAKEGTKVLKTSARDLPYIISTKKNGATTVSATCVIAQMANIKVFATGGIGGVHRNATQTMDISNDLEQIGKSDVSVVCAGPKAILDLGLTLEYLETKGIEVIGYQTDYLPAFYSQTSVYPINHRVDSPEEIATMIKIKIQLKLPGGLLITNPIPKQYSISPQIIEEALNTSLKEMNDLGIQGKEATPFLLSKIKDLTSGKSLAANIELVKNNARLAAKIAKLL
jgi:pseudouridine-5'-phosphate glycosidase